jgi:hypothetical protein
LVAIRLLLNWCRRRNRRRLRTRSSGGGLIAIRLNILPGRDRLLRCVRRCGSRNGARGNYCGNGFALRDWLGGCEDGRLPVVDGSELLVILRGLFAMLNLSGHRRNTLFACGG